MSGDQRLKLHIKNNRSGEDVFRMTPGRVAEALARAARKLGLYVIGVRRHGKPARYAHEMHGSEAINELLPRADFVLVTTPLVPDTKSLIDARRLDLLKPTAGLINMSRARVVDYGHLAKKTHRGQPVRRHPRRLRPGTPAAGIAPVARAQPDRHTPHLIRRRRLLHAAYPGPVPRQRPPGTRRPAAAQPGEPEVGLLRYNEACRRFFQPATAGRQPFGGSLRGDVNAAHRR